MSERLFTLALGVLLAGSGLGCDRGAPVEDAARSPEQIREAAPAIDTERLEGIIRDYEHTLAVMDEMVELGEYVRLSRNLEIYRAERARRD